MEDVILLMNSGQSRSKIIKFELQNIRLINSKEEETEVEGGTLTVDLGTSNTALLAKNAIHVYPNITNHFLYLSSDLSIVAAIISNLQGQQIEFIQQPNNRIEVEHLEKGMYILELLTPKGRLSKKFVVD